MEEGNVMRVWQIGGGDSGRDYSQWLIAHDIACLGPGEYGRYSRDEYDRCVASGLLSSHKAGAIRQFKENVRPGDIVLLRRGHLVVSIGLFADEPYDWNPGFDDVRGWDLQHFRRVIWQERLHDELEATQRESPLFGDRKQIPMFTRVEDPSVLDRANDLLRRVTTRKLRALPSPPSDPLDDEALAHALFSRGLSNRATDDVVASLGRQRRLIEWYEEYGKASSRPTEHEVVAHVVLPLLRALGWSEQLLAVEWKRIDLAGFASAPTTPDSCSLVCEAKGLGHGLEAALTQAISYVDREALTNCRRILLTDGARFYLYSRDGTEWSEELEPASYLNVRRPRLKNADGTNGVDLIMTLRQRWTQNH